MYYFRPPVAVMKWFMATPRLGFMFDPAEPFSPAGSVPFLPGGVPLLLVRSRTDKCVPPDSTARLGTLIDQENAVRGTSVPQIARAPDCVLADAPHDFCFAEDDDRGRFMTAVRDFYETLAEAGPGKDASD